MFKPRLKEKVRYSNRRRYIFDAEVEKELRKLYLIEKKNCYEIGNLWDVPHATISRWLEKFEIPTRDTKEIQRLNHNHPEVSERMRKAHTKGKTKKFDDSELESELRKLYLQEKKSLPVIGKKFKANRGQVLTWLRRFNIPVRTLSESIKLKWLEPGYRAKCTKASKDRFNDPEFQKKFWESCERHPNSLEVKMIYLLKEMNLENFEFVGDFREDGWIGGYNPDFLNRKDKKIIETNGSFWHKNLVKVKDRIKTFGDCGYETLIVWDKEFKNLPRLKSKIELFAKMKLETNVKNENMEVSND